MTRPAAVPETLREAKNQARDMAKALFTLLGNNVLLAEGKTAYHRYALKFFPDKVNARLGLEPGTEDYVFFLQLSQNVNAAFGAYEARVNSAPVAADDAEVEAQRARARAKAEARRRAQEEQRRRVDEERQRQEERLRRSVEEAHQRAEQARQAEEAKRTDINAKLDSNPVLKDIVGILKAAMRGEVCEIAERDQGFSVVIELPQRSFNQDKKAAFMRKVKQLSEAGLSVRVLDLPRVTPALVIDLKDLPSNLRQVSNLFGEPQHGEESSLQAFMKKYLSAVCVGSKESVSTAANSALDTLERSEHELNSDEVQVATALLNGVLALNCAEHEITEQPLLSQTEKTAFVNDLSQRREGLMNFCMSSEVGNKQSRDIFLKWHVVAAKNLQTKMPRRLAALDVFIGVIATIFTLGLVNVSKTARAGLWGGRQPEITGLEQYATEVIASPAA